MFEEIIHLKVKEFNEKKNERTNEYTLLVKEANGYISVNKHTDNEQDFDDTLFSVERTEDEFIIHTMLDEVEQDVLDSIQRAGYKGMPNIWFLEFNIRLKTEDEVVKFLEKHFWTKDIGPLY